MKSTIAGALFTIVLATPAMAVELYHCTVNNVTDGFFNSLDLKVDGQTIAGSAEIKGSPSNIGNDLVGFFYTDGAGLRRAAIVYSEGREATETLSFALTQVVSKLGPATRYTAKEGFGSYERPVEMICDMATPL